MLRAWLLLYLSLPLVKMKYDMEKTNGDPFYYCMRTYNVSRDQLELITEDIDAAIDDYKLQCYIGCVMEMTGLLDACRVKRSSLFTIGEMKPINGLQMDTITAIFTRCESKMEYNEDPCSCGYSLAKCLQGVMEAVV